MENRTKSALVAAVVWSVLVSFSQAELISVDFVGGNPASLPPSGDTTLAAGLAQNADGLIFTGQNGAWNALNVTAYGNANYGSVSTGFLADGSGATTTVKLTVGSHRGNYPYENGNLRQEAASTWYSGPVSLTLTGLDPQAQYDLVVFGKTGNLHRWNNAALTYDEMIANGIPATYDTEGDFNWTGLSSDVDGNIFATLPPTAGMNDNAGGSMTGLQIQLVVQEEDPAIPEPLTLALLGLSAGGLGGYLRRRSA